MLKSILNTHQQVRDLNAAAFDAYQYETEGPLGKLRAATGKGYAEKARELPRDEVNKILGPPHVHLMNTIISWLLSMEIGANNRIAMAAIAEQ